MSISAAPAQPVRLYQHPLSGHAHRVELFLSLLGVPFEKVLVDLLKGEHKSADFLAKNPAGQVPVIEDGDLTLADSNAILVYLARRYDASGRWLPDDAVRAARVQQWLSTAAGELASGACRARVDVLFKRQRDRRAHEIAVSLLSRMDRHLATGGFLAAEWPTIADVALYTYTSHVPEGGVSLGGAPNVRAWLSRIEALPGFVGMVRGPDAPPIGEE